MLLSGDKLLVAATGQSGGTGDDFVVTRYLLGDVTPVTAKISPAGILQITGTPGPDAIRLGVSGGRLSVTGVDQTFAANAFSRVEIVGLAGDDLIDASAATFPLLIDAGPGDDFILAAASDDSLLGGAGHDTLFGGRGRDTLRGNDGRDYLNPGPGADTVFGDAGDDQIFSLDGPIDAIDGGPGFDRAKGDPDDLFTSTENVHT
jgi:Ca2+-binding RTX toxin-like protein